MKPSVRAIEAYTDGFCAYRAKRANKKLQGWKQVGSMQYNLF